LGHRSKIKYRIRLSQYQESKRFNKNIKIDLITPNHEIIQLSPAETNAENIAKMLSAHCAILLKGGHHQKNWCRYFIYKRDHPVFAKSSLTKNMVQGCVYRLLLFLTLLLGNG
jgi:hydroxymethylpyrimidine/phosphomethylpyrimidine kinase